MRTLVRRVQRAYRRGGVLRFVAYARDRLTRPFVGYSLNFAYTKDFFEYNIADGRPMAEYLAPKIAEALGIRRVLDLGCGAGHWVGAFLRCGVDAFGVEGSRYAYPMLLCPKDRVIFADLRKPLRLKPTITEGVDSVLSLEVAEHIEQRYAPVFVANLVKYRPTYIIMTAATPGQGGNYHVNEQAPEYWTQLLARSRYRSDTTTKAVLVGLVDDARQHDIHIPFWMPKNLLAFRRDA
jgi:hypothetical protein